MTTMVIAKSIIGRLRSPTSKCLPFLGGQISYNFQPHFVVKRTLISSNACLGRLFTQKHERISVKDKIGTVGISDHAQAALGDVVFSQLPEIGKQLAQEEYVREKPAFAAKDLTRTVYQERAESMYSAFCQALNLSCVNAEGNPVAITLASRAARREFVHFLMQNSTPDVAEEILDYYYAADELYNDFFTNEMDENDFDECSQQVVAAIHFFREITLPVGSKEAFQKFLNCQGESKRVNFDDESDEFK